ncbi:MAG TPA: hypothetical protein VFQ44_08505 [Streptosporangiaceae bacterium]|nr:hypothetical protein [Streptosporangiaceae bacterium]
MIEWERRRTSVLLPPAASENSQRPPDAGAAGTGFRIAQEFERRTFEASLTALGGLGSRDTRTDSQYKGEVERYFSGCREYYSALALFRWSELVVSRLELDLVNASERNYADIQVQIKLHGPVRVLDPIKIVKPTELPAAPRPRGTPDPARPAWIGLVLGTAMNAADFRTPFPPVLSRPRAFRIIGDVASTVMYEIQRARPEQYTQLDSLVLAPMMAQEGTTMQVAWSVAPGNVDGLVRGLIELRIGPSIDAAELLLELTDESSGAD